MDGLVVSTKEFSHVFSWEKERDSLKKRYLNKSVTILKRLFEMQDDLLGLHHLKEAIDLGHGYWISENGVFMQGDHEQKTANNQAGCNYVATRLWESWYEANVDDLRTPEGQTLLHHVLVAGKALLAGQAVGVHHDDDIDVLT